MTVGLVPPASGATTGSVISAATAAPADPDLFGEPVDAQSEPALPGAPRVTAQASSAGVTYQRPSSGYFEIQGQGSGHGRGLSQYGAKGAAEAGKTTAQILDFYYPNSSNSQVNGAQPIRVWISFGQGAAGTPRSTVNDSPEVGVVSGLVVTDQTTGKNISYPSDAKTITSRVKGNGFEVVALGAPGGTKVLGETAGPVLYHGPEQLTLHFSSGTRGYRGTMTAVRYGAGAMTVNTLRLEDYLRGVVPREMPASWPKAALQAQAVAARTYAMANLRTDRAWDICDTTYCQAYGGTTALGGEVASTDQAIAATAGTIRTYQGKPINAQFGASSGGYTVDGGVKYLLAAADPWDRAGIPASLAVWNEKLQVSALEKAYPAIGSLRSLTVLSRDGMGAFGGRVMDVELAGSSGSVRITGNTIRSLAGFESNLFNVLPTTPETSPKGAYDGIRRTGYGAVVGGWAVDPDHPEQPVTVEVTLTWPNRKEVYTRVANQARADVARVYPEFGPDHGYNFDVPFTGVGTVNVCIVAVNIGNGSPNKSLGCKSLTATKPIGRLDGVSVSGRTLSISGWALSKDVPTESIRVAVSWTGPNSANHRRWADSVRNDVANAYPGVGPLHGYKDTLTVPSAGTYHVCLSTDQVAHGEARVQLGCKDVVVH